MARLVSRAEAWEKAYEAFNQINFTAFDYTSIKQSIVDYLKLYFPESFNDFIESSEFIAMIEIFAYLGELLIYRVDVSSHENFIGVAQRKQNVLRLAKLISYRATRNIPARGLLKITSLTTSEDLYDTRGTPLKGKQVSWNDTNNLLWKEQFLTIMNSATLSNIGTVNPGDRVQVDNVLFELYSLNNVPTQRSVLPYAVSVDGTSYPMEIVPVRVDRYGPTERRPENGGGMTLLYGSDGFGNDSPTTGFFFFTKQGTLSSTRSTFDGKTPNQYIDIPTSNINDTDLWVNNIDITSEQILNDGSIRTKRSGEWEEVDTTSAQNVIFSYTNGRNRFETETLDNDQVRVVFGDGEFANIPAGTFDFWYRTSANENLSIPLNAVIDKAFSLRYIDKLGQPQTLQFTVSLISNLQNASASEDIEHIRRVAPSVYYTQNRMVNGADYNLYPLKDPTILKLRTVNRTYAGESKYSRWHDTSETYENVKLAGDDMIVMFENYTDAVRVTDPVDTDKLFTNYIIPTLSAAGTYTRAFINRVQNIRRTFTADEMLQISTVLQNNVWPDPVYIIYNATTGVYSASTAGTSDYVMLIDATMNGGNVIGWTVSNAATKMTIESPTTRFWAANGSAIVAEDTLTAERDKIILLKANTNKYDQADTNTSNESRIRTLSTAVTMVPSGVVYDELSGLQNINKLEVVAYDAVQSELSGTGLVGELIDPDYTISVAASGSVPVDITLPFAYVRGMNEISVSGVGTSWVESPGVALGDLTTTVRLSARPASGLITVTRTSFVYHQRVSASAPWKFVTTTGTVRTLQALEELAGVSAQDRKYRRTRGRSGLNFMWMHQTSMFHLVDPSPTNINDAFVIQKGYYNNLQTWLEGNGAQPLPPTPMQLRNDYKDLLVNAMISDTVVFHPGKIKLVIGDKAAPQLQAKFLVVKNPRSVLTDSQIKLKVRDVVRSFFDITYWEFGESFYFTELSAVIHKELASDINSVVLVPLYPNHFFGDMFQVNMSEDEIIQADVDIDDVEITTALNAVNTNQAR
jgi:hypothetical protein